MRSRSLIPWALAALSGILYFVGFVGFGQWMLTWIALVPLLLALRGAKDGRRAFLLSWTMGLVTHLGGYYWIVTLLQNFAHLPTPLAVLGYVLLCAFQGASLAVFGYLAWRLHRDRGIPIGLTAPLGLMAAEQLYPQIFPNYISNSFAFVPALTQIVELGGPLLLSGVIALVNGAIAELLAARLERRPLPRRLPIAAACAVAATLIFGAVRMGQIDRRDAAAPKLRTAIIQANVGAGSKHESVEAGIAEFRRMTDEAMQDPTLDLVVWPETAYNRLVPAGANLTGRLATEIKTPMIVGALRGDRKNGRVRSWNSAVAVAPGGGVGTSYDKIALLAFGEYVPLGETFPVLYEALPYTARMERGTSHAPLRVGPWALSADICYEDILPGLIRELMGPIDEHGTRPHALVNLTNDSWYGPAEPPIHLALSVFRAIEHRRWMIRSTATGLSAFIDSAGRLRQRSDFEEAQTLVEDVPMITGGPTVYGAIGGVFEWGVAFGTVGLAFWSAIRRLRKRSVG